MYKLHYDVDAGKQLNVVYEGVEFEVQAGTGGGSDVEVETNKIVHLTTNGIHVIEPSIDKDAMAKVTADVNVPTNLQNYKRETITRNGMHTIEPSSGFDGMRKVIATVQVPTSGDVEVEENKTVTITQNGTVEITPSVDKDAMAKVTATVNVPSSGGDRTVLVDRVYVDPIYGGTYRYSGGDRLRVIICTSTEDQFLEGTTLSISAERCRLQNNGDDDHCSIHFDYIGYRYESLEFNCEDVEAGSLSVMNVGELVFRGVFFSDVFMCDSGGGSTNGRCIVYGGFYVSCFSLRGYDLYLYSNDFYEDFSWLGNPPRFESIHVLTTFPYDTFGGVAVIKDLTPP